MRRPWTQDALIVGVAFFLFGLRVALTGDVWMSLFMACAALGAVLLTRRPSQ